ncbi:MAG: hypothetical protein II728_02855, partial [Bacteroidaceae bacterium]|nr:hypothetical protein [Bacteroidaceae bacterium]
KPYFSKAMQRYALFSKPPNVFLFFLPNFLKKIFLKNLSVLGCGCVLAIVSKRQKSENLR